MTATLIPFSLRDAPALIERLMPVQKLSAEAYKEQMAVHGKTLTALGSYWKGRKPLILAKACIFGCLLPATDNAARDLEVFEMLMGMDMASLERRLEDKDDKQTRFILGQERSVGYREPYRAWVHAASRAEECGDEIFDHIWDDVNSHLGTCAHSMQELVEQLGVMRFGHRPRLADTFCGSGQIPFEAARLGCEVYASDLNPIACMLTWGAFNVVGGSREIREKIAQGQEALVHRLQEVIDGLGIEADGYGWRVKVLLYCVEVRCSQSGWMVPLLPRSENNNGEFNSAMVISKGYKVIAELIPNHKLKRYDITIRSGVSDREVETASMQGTVRSDGRGKDPYLIHTIDGKEYRTKISTLRGDYRKDDGSIGNRLRLWEKHDFKPRPEDIFQERIYAIQWARTKPRGKGEEFQFRSVTSEDMNRERIVEDFVAKHIADWQTVGWLPDMRIEPGDETDRLSRERGWTYWHHLFNPRQLLVLGLIRGSNAVDIKWTLLSRQLKGSICSGTTPFRIGSGIKGDLEQLRTSSFLLFKVELLHSNA